jgi:hypothetical protein
MLYSCINSSRYPLVDLKAGLDAVEKRNSLALPGSDPSNYADSVIQLSCAICKKKKVQK